jgi:sugar phosphate isomerase/epimerase
MKLSVSNIAWSAEQDESMYAFLAAAGYRGLEVAPTRLFPQSPYMHLDEARAFAAKLSERYGLRVCSMQSIWFGRTERLFGDAFERDALMDYTKKAVLFAEALGCPNLVFGSPKNRVLPEPSLRPLAVDFLREAGDFAARYGCVVSVEPNPAIYGTNFINTSAEAFALCREVQSPGCMVNADLGACTQNGESLSVLRDNIDLVHHIHVSEPMLAPIARRTLHTELRTLKYDGWISIEMKRTDDLAAVQDAAEYVTEVLS